MYSALGLLALADGVLRGDTSASRQRLERDRPTLGSLVLGVLVFGTFYGGVMGMYGGVSGPRLLQVAYSAIKVPILLFVTFLLSLPSFFVLNTLLGLRSDFSRVLQSLLATQTGLTVILAALAPFTAIEALRPKLPKWWGAKRRWWEPVRRGMISHATIPRGLTR